MKLETGNWKQNAGVEGAGKAPIANCQLPTANCTGARRRAGFTLIEMLVVVVIILILLGVVFRMVRPASDQANRANTAARLERFKAALEEFYAEYGQYPPVPYYKNVFDGYAEDGSKVYRLGKIVPENALAQPVMYEYPTTNGMSSDLTGIFEDETWNTAPLFTFGLMSFLVKRHTDRADGAWPTLLDLPQWGDDNSAKKDQLRDERAIARWAPFIAGETYSDIVGRLQRDQFMWTYFNAYVSARDAWERDFIYVSPSPHQSYLLFSRGPDGDYDVSDPGNRNSTKNKDNVYGDTGH